MATHEDKVELLRKVDLFSGLREYELDIIAKYSEFLGLKKGDPVFAQDSPAEELYVVDKGRIGIISLENANVTIAQIVQGESFGELDFLGRIQRSASAFAEDESVVLRFPAKGYNAQQIFQDHPYISANMLYRLLGIVSERIWSVNKLLGDKTFWLLDLHKQLLCDKMTGLYNQTFLQEDFVNMLPELGEGAALLMIKPDNFKEINDRFGHTSGDSVLRLMAIFLQSELREYDIGVRYRGDEFAAIIGDVDKTGALKKARDISNTFRDMDISGITGSDKIQLKVSIGIAFYPADTGESAELVSIAHRRMMKARETGGNRVVV